MESETLLLMTKINITSEWQTDIACCPGRTQCHQCNVLTENGEPESNHEGISENLK